MSPSLEQYFEQSVLLPEQGGGTFSEAERAFLSRYMGDDFEAALARSGLSRPAAVVTVSGEPAPDPEPAEARASADVEDAAALEASLAEARELKLVGFTVAGQELAVPIAQVQEVLRAMPLTRLPAAPAHIAGVTNLRGRVAPMVDLARIMDLCGDCAQQRFVIVCRCRGMLLGLLVEAISTMHQASGDDVEWGVEARVGVASDMVLGLLKVGERLVKILSVDSLFQKVLKS
ncbi:MAG: chemotaxis signal transduction protein [Solidesulfovibrio magneticus str. Maddingley MBC34]|uniref:Chemotaxis signal transduction protein n=1 Tax=Solidesulfovibrio magneticus str. Maddingley MBC34 TaxID=1206767 RepID=K6GDC1_9BACT|nr:MAG: chemotaxis signal transduction protein [Solidesulfovibrio magneticus str. Maddingley MBC34]